MSFSSNSGTFHLALYEGKLCGVASVNPPIALSKILLSRGLLTPEQYQKFALDNQVFSDDLSTIRTLSSISEEQIQLAIYHQAEELFFQLLEVNDGRYEYHAESTHNFLMFDIAFRDWLDEVIPDIELMKTVRKDIPDLDGKIIWVSPEEIRDLPDQLNLEELKILSQYKPGISFRAFWYILTEPRMRIILALQQLQKFSVFTVHPPTKPKLPDSRPFLRALLASAIMRLEDAFRAIGSEGEILTVLKSIADGIDKSSSMIPATTTSVGSENLDDLSSITSSIEDILSIDNLEDLDIKKESPEKPLSAATAETFVRPQSAEPTTTSMDSRFKKPVSRSGIEDSSIENSRTADE